MHIQKKWSQSEVKFIENNINKMGNLELAKHLNRPIRSVTGYIERNKIKRDPDFLAELIGNKGVSKNKGSSHYKWKGGVRRNNYLWNKIQEKRYPERMKAREKARKALYAGKIIKTPCEICGVKKTQMHHDNYFKPLDVRFLCPICHRRIDKEIVLKNQSRS